jgi:hypothetical protein
MVNPTEGTNPVTERPNNSGGQKPKRSQRARTWLAIVAIIVVVALVLLYVLSLRY